MDLTVESDPENPEAADRNRVSAPGQGPEKASSHSPNRGYAAARNVPSIVQSAVAMQHEPLRPERPGKPGTAAQAGGASSSAEASWMLKDVILSLFNLSSAKNEDFGSPSGGVLILY